MSGKASYEIEDPTEQHWWEESYEGEPSEEFRDVIEGLEIETEFVYGNETELIDPENAFRDDDIEEIKRAVEEYDEAEEFLEDVRKSNIHPQQTKQIERMIQNSVYTPNGFSSYDGFPEVK